MFCSRGQSVALGHIGVWGMLRLWVLVLSGTILSGQAPQGEGQETGSMVQPGAGQLEESNDSDSAAVQYLIGPGDVLQILVWNEPDFSGDFTVRFDGKMTLPLVGEVDAAGRTTDQVSGYLAEELKRFVEAPRVTVSVAEANSARFFVLGKVATQGAFPYTGRIRVVQALAMAGGFLEFAKLDKIMVIRERQGELVSLQVNYQRLVDNQDLEANVVIQPGDTIIVP